MYVLRSWLHLTASVAIPRGGGGAPARAGGEGGDLFQSMEEKRKVSEISGDCVSDTYPLCESCAHKVAVELNAAHDLVSLSA